MIDIHSHILPGTDDGAKDEQMSLEMLKKAHDDGITHVIATPHSQTGEYIISKASIKRGTNLLNQEAAERNYKTKIFTGTEWAMESGIPGMLSEGSGCTLADSRYILVEFAPWQEPKFYTNAFFEIMMAGFVPILAHPERYLAIQRDPHELYRIAVKGVLIQVNSTSITGLEGKDIKRFTLNLIKHDIVHFVASDAHSTGKRAPALSEAYRIVSGRFGEATAERLFVSNGMAVIKDEEIQTDEPIPFRRNRFFYPIPKKKAMP